MGTMEQASMIEAVTDVDAMSAGVGALGGGGVLGSLLLMWRWLLGHTRASQQDLNALMLQRLKTLEERDAARQAEVTQLLTARAEMERDHGQQMLALSGKLSELEAARKDLQGQVAELERARDQMVKQHAEEVAALTARIVELESALIKANAKVERLRQERREIGLVDSESEAVDA